MHEEMDTKKMWDKVLSDVELSVSKPNFSTWFKDTYILKFDSGFIFLAVKNNFVSELLSTKFHNLILKSLRDISTSIHSLQYTIVKDDKKNMPPKEKMLIINKELPLDNYYINRDE